MLLDLFKAKAGVRLGCDLSSADDAGVRWGHLMLRVVDDVAATLQAGGGSYGTKLICPLSGQMFVDAVITTCCGSSSSRARRGAARP